MASMGRDAPIPTRYRSLSSYLRDRFGERVYKVSIDAGFSCPNRDGKKALGGCTFCNNEGFSPPTRVDTRDLTEAAPSRNLLPSPSHPFPKISGLLPGVHQHVCAD